MIDKQDKSKRTNRIIIGFGITGIAAVSGLSVLGTMTAINAMNRQSDEMLQATRIAAAARNSQNNPGSTQASTEPVVTEPIAEPADTKPVAEELWSDQIAWMQANHIHYNEYGLPENEDGVIVDDPTTDIYEPDRMAYFYNEDGTPKLPYQKDEPDPGPDVVNPTVEPEPSGPETPGSESGEDDPVEPVTEPTKPAEEPGDVVKPGTSDDDSSSGEPSEPSGEPSEEQPAPWWLDENGKLLSGLKLDEDGKPYYVVKKGDWLSRIAARYGFNYMELAKASGISNPNLIYTGDIIRFPDISGGNG